MKIHEHQAKALLREFAVPVPRGDIATTPEKILREWAHPALGLADHQARRLAFGLGLAGAQFKQGVGLIRSLFTLYLAKDCSLAEINPLVLTRDGRVLALDAKLNFDDNA